MSDKPMLEIELDGEKVQVPEGSMVMHAADKAGTYIPHFCYHKKLSIAANCRMCLVEVEKAPKPLPACATPVSPGMKAYTRSEKAIRAQQEGNQVVYLLVAQVLGRHQATVALLVIELRRVAHVRLEVGVAPVIRDLGQVRCVVGALAEYGVAVDTVELVPHVLPAHDAVGDVEEPPPRD